MQSIFSCILALLISYHCNGQAFKKDLFNLSADERAELTSRESERIKNATLIIILPYYESKISRFEQLLNNPEADNKSAKRVQYLLNSTIADRDSFNLDFLNNFTKEYTRTKVEFLYDKDLSHFIESPNTRFFLSDLGQYKTDQKYSNEYFFGGFYHERSSNSTGGYYFVIADDELKIYPKSMFSFIKVDNTLVHILTFGFSKKFGRADIIGKKVNARMEKNQ